MGHGGKEVHWRQEIERARSRLPMVSGIRKKKLVTLKNVLQIEKQQQGGNHNRKQARANAEKNTVQQKVLSYGWVFFTNQLLFANANSPLCSFWHIFPF